MAKKNVVIVGSSNIDYIGKSDASLIACDSNPGRITITYGGVGRNICESLARLDVDVTFITAIGNDGFGLQMEQELLDLKVKVIKPITNKNSASYLAIHDNNGEMKLALVDTSIVSDITIDFLKENDNVFRNADFIMIDLNQEIDIIEYLVNRYSDKFIITDGISTTKVLKIRNVMEKISLLKVNELEYQTLQNNNIVINPQNLVVSRGKKPLFYLNGENNEKESFNIPLKNKIVSVTGAGDALVAGIIFGLTNDNSVRESIKYGIKLADITLDSIDTVNKNIKKEMFK